MSRSRFNFASASLKPKMPDIFGRGDEVPSDICGSKIVAFGTLKNRGKVYGGGLVIDYLSPKDDTIHRAVFSLSDVGMTVIYKGPRTS
jgi:hypothetical protein